MLKQSSDNAPFCLGIALLENKEALRCFAALSIPQQQDFIENAHAFTTPEEIRLYVENIRKVDSDVK